jgi:GMP synthase (glutamine-hydrolysing)
VSRLLILKTGSTVPTVLSRRRDFEVWITSATGWNPAEVATVSVHKGEEAWAPERYAGIVVTGSPSMVTDREPWSELAGQYLLRAMEQGTPILGICYGHQLLCQTLGGTVSDNPRGRQIGTVDVTLTADAADDPLFGHFASPLHVPTSHLQSVVELPKQGRLLGSSALDPNHVVRFGERTWGVQFHPEFDAAIVRDYIDARRQDIEREGLDAEALKAAAIDSADGTILLRRFASLAKKR